MKKLAGLILVSTLLWSCGSQFSRSKYDRYQWNRSHGKIEVNETEEAKVEKTDAEKSNENTTPGISIVSNDDDKKIIKTVTAVTSEKSNRSFHIMKNNRKDNETQFRSELNNYRSVSELPKDDVKLVWASKLKNKINKKIHSRKAADGPLKGGDVELIILVILAILLPPLGVYLKDGGITGLFWLTLILCLLGGGFLFGPFFLGGFFLIAVILALLRVFDMI